jgi:histidyl-tRNA synthetase
MIAMLTLMIEEIGIPSSALEVSLNSLGEPEERAAYREALVAFYRGHLDVLDEEARRRLETNPLRILDSKNPDIVALNANAPVLLETLSPRSQARFAKVRELLAALGVRHTLDQRLVRGLDYYTATIFEIKTTAGELGAQNTICGGGRYDGLVASLGGPKTPAIGFALGVERTLLALTQPAESYEPAVSVFFAPMDPAALAYALPLAHGLRAHGIRVEVEHRGGSLKSLFKRADKLRARAVVVIGENEVASGNLTVKDLAKGTQSTIPAADLESKIHQLLD